MLYLLLLQHTITINITLQLLLLHNIVQEKFSISPTNVANSDKPFMKQNFDFL